MPETGDPRRVALEYIEQRDTAIARYKGHGGALFGNSSQGTQLQFIEMCNRFSTRFADQFPDTWNLPEWERMGRADIRNMQYILNDLFPDAPALDRTTWEAMSELSKTYRHLPGLFTE